MSALEENVKVFEVGFVNFQPLFVIPPEEEIEGADGATESTVKVVDEPAALERSEPSLAQALTV
ncbi:hypothetical protein [Glutamicibacter sp. NPDC087673]|uniref:hypothetical protein n=1 Tax=Glutamicibacter sp. NPDC087673 TaxID=3363997 RepID=UPI0038266D63